MRITRIALPITADLKRLGAAVTRENLHVGTLGRLQARSGARLAIAAGVRDLFGHPAFSGPVAMERVCCDVAAVGVDFYQCHRGAKQRKVYLHGEVVTLPLQMGVVQLGDQGAFRREESGAEFVMFRQQVVTIVKGQLVLEGNTPAS